MIPIIGRLAEKLIRGQLNSPDWTLAVQILHEFPQTEFTPKNRIQVALMRAIAGKLYLDADAWEKEIDKSCQTQSQK